MESNEFEAIFLPGTGSRNTKESWRNKKTRNTNDFGQNCTNGCKNVYRACGRTMFSEDSYGYRPNKSLMRLKLQENGVGDMIMPLN